MNFVVFVNGMMLLFMAALMLPCAVFFPETAGVFAQSALLAGIVGLGLVLSSAAGIGPIRNTHTFLLTASVWISAGLAGALPLYLWNLPAVDALFEGISGITASGSTVMSGLDATAPGILLWRALLQAVGGIGIIVTGIALLPILKVGGMQLFRTESSDRGEKELGTAARFAGATLVIYIGLIVLCALIYVAGGMSAFDAVTHAMTTVATGGFSNYDASFGHFDSAFLQWAATLFMLLGALPFAWYIRAALRRQFRSEQIVMMLRSLAVVIGGLTLWLWLDSGMALLDALRLVMFNVVSIVTTTGYATTDYTLWGPAAAAAFFVLTAVGGCTGSTSGGAKAMRWLLMARAIRAAVRKVHAPHAVTTIRYEGRAVGDDVISGVIAFFTLYFATFVTVAFILGFLGLDMTTATSGALTAVANVGPGIGPVIGPAGNFAPLPDAAKLVLTAAMYLGRLEILTVFVLLTPTFWREV